MIHKRAIKLSISHEGEDRLVDMVAVDSKHLIHSH